MSNLKNNVQLIGHLGMDPEIKTLENGATLARFSIAIADGYKDKTGNWLEDTMWFNIIAWDTLAERVEQNLKKGSYVMLNGKLISRSYLNNDQQKKHVIEIRLNNYIQFDQYKRKNVENEEIIQNINSQADDDLPF